MTIVFNEPFKKKKSIHAVVAFFFMK